MVLEPVKDKPIHAELLPTTARKPFTVLGFRFWKESRSFSFLFFSFLCVWCLRHGAKEKGQKLGLALGLHTLADELWLLGASGASRDELVFYKGPEICCAWC